ncbi:MAG: hypothetical protein CM1200mP2_57900 [Planctomycetaceae bacterium]|nr:MAG: hypothetical protein CM1200mP2_57900 [Planctomycetaceae bacterium]
MTMACVQCHDHPYDPIWHDEYYRYRNIFEPVQVAIDRVVVVRGEWMWREWPGSSTGSQRCHQVLYPRQRQDAGRDPQDHSRHSPGDGGDGWNPRRSACPTSPSSPPPKAGCRANLARLNDNIRPAEKAMATAEALVVDFQKRLEKPASAPTKPGAGNLIRDTFTPQTRPQVAEWFRPMGGRAGGGLVQSSVGDDVEGWIDSSPGWFAREFTLHVALKITGGKKNREAGITFDRHEKGGPQRGGLSLGGQEQDRVGFFSEFEGNVITRSPVSALTCRGARVSDPDPCPGRLINVYVNECLCRLTSCPRQPGGIRFWTYDASAEFSLLQVDPGFRATCVGPGRFDQTVLPFAVLDPGDASHPAFSRRCVSRRGSNERFNGRNWPAQAAWTADAFRLFEAPPKEGKTAVEDHKKKLEPLAIVAQLAQRQLAVAKAREAKFLADRPWPWPGPEASRTDARCRQGCPADDGRATGQGRDDAEKKVESTAKQVASAVETVEKPSTPRYSGFRGMYGSSSGVDCRWLVGSRT